MLDLVKSAPTHYARRLSAIFYKQTKDGALLQEIFNHSEAKITLRYTGINQDSIDQAMKKFSLLAHLRKCGWALFWKIILVFSINSP